MKPESREVTCPKCGATFIRRGGGIAWAGCGGQGWYRDLEHVDWCFECWTGWTWPKDDPAALARG